MAKRTRVLIKKIMPGVVEVPWLKQKNAGYVAGLKTMLEHFCYISVFNNENSFPKFVKKLPQADYSSDGAGTIRGFAVESKTTRWFINKNDEAVECTPHKHAASFGVVLKGECELVIEGESKVYRAGGLSCFGSARHFARQSANYKDIVIFNEPGRVPVVK